MRADELETTQYDYDPVFPHDSKEDLPKLLAIIAPLGKLGIPGRDQEVVSYKFCVLDFIDSAFGKMSNYDFCVVGSSFGMLFAISRFSATLKQNERPFLVFCGHGDSQGSMLFSDNFMEATIALKKIERSFTKYRPAGVNKWPLRCIFTQCYGHLLDTSTPRPGEIIPYSHNMEFAYLTDESSPLHYTRHEIKHPPCSR